ncbi:MAG: site-specific integrase [Clostridiales bacterium]|nr:site-specific integrase [Clostridiales bacterium]
MHIDRIISFFVDKEGGKPDGRLRMRVKWNRSAHVVSLLVGFRVEPAKWSAETQRCKTNTTHGKEHTPASVINRTIQAHEDAATEIFSRFERDGIMPTPEEFRHELRAALSRTADTVKADLGYYMDLFIEENKSLNAWVRNTEKNFITLRNHLTAFKPQPTFKMFTEAGLLAFTEFLRDECGMRNSTISKHISLLKWFLRWSSKKGYLHDQSFLLFNPRLKKTRNEIVFLDWGELLKVYDFPIPETKQYLSRVRDVFCFACFTGLRYSDLANLRTSDVHEDSITITSIKTADRLTIELNKYSRAIAEKYRDFPRENDRYFPVISNQKMNDYIKELGELCGLDTPVTKVYYRGSERCEEIAPKWRLMGVHTARRTFISNAIQKGIPPQIVMKWTGHSDYAAMKPYIEIAERAKREAMRAFDE